jgi:hypothetical protein
VEFTNSRQSSNQDKVLRLCDNIERLQMICIFLKGNIKRDGRPKNYLSKSKVLEEFRMESLSSQGLSQQEKKIMQILHHA